MNRRVNRPTPAQNSSSGKVANKKSTHQAQSAWFSSHISFASTASAMAGTSLRAWLAHHRFSCVDSLQRLCGTPWQSLATALVVAIALVLPALLYLAFDQAKPLQHTWKDHTQIALYIQQGAKPRAVNNLQRRLQESTSIASVTLITPDMAKQDFQENSGLGNVLSSLEENPLPYVLLVQPVVQGDGLSSQVLEKLRVTLAADPIVEEAQLDTQWLRRLHEMSTLAQRIALVLALLLAIGVVLVIGNTIRLAIDSRHNEIVVIKMVGGTDGFVKRPFLYTGFWYGFFGAVFSLFILLLIQWWISDPVKQLASLYDSGYTLSIVGLETLSIVILMASSLGWLGAWLSVSRHLQHIEPE